MCKKMLAALLILSCLMFSGCSENSLSESSRADLNSASGTVQLPEGSLLTTVFAVTPGDIESFSYEGNAPYYFGGQNGIWPKEGYSAILFSCPNQKRINANAYMDREQALVGQFSQALRYFAVDQDFVENMTGDTVLPDGDYMSFNFIFRGEYSAGLTIFESGDIYLTLNDGSGAPARHYKAVDAGDYIGLKKEIEEIRAALDALPLDYQLSMGVYPEQFLPESTAIRLQIDNIGAQPVTYSKSFVVEQWESGVWRQLSEKEAPEITAEMLTVEPRSTGYYAADITNLESGREVGRYRVTNTFCAGKEKLTLTAYYEINAAAFDVSLPFKPEMTPENQAYYDKYLSAWGFYCPFERDYNEQTFAQDFRPYLLYFSSAAQEGKQEEYDKFGVDIPAQIVEGTVTRHFPVTAEQFRASLSKSQNLSEYYDVKQNSYHFEGGYGGGSLSGVVTRATREGDLLTLFCDWYGMDDSFCFSHTVTIRLGEEDGDFYYMENTVTKEAGAQGKNT